MNLIYSRRIAAFSAGLVCAVSCLGETTGFERDCEKLAQSRSPDATCFQQLLTLDWERTLQENPEFATEIGQPGLNDRWSDISLAAVARRKRELSAPLKTIQSINRVTSSGPARRSPTKSANSKSRNSAPTPRRNWVINSTSASSTIKCSAMPPSRWVCWKSESKIG